MFEFSWAIVENELAACKEVITTCNDCPVWQLRNTTEDVRTFAPFVPSSIGRGDLCYDWSLNIESMLTCDARVLPDIPSFLKVTL